MSNLRWAARVVIFSCTLVLCSTSYASADTITFTFDCDIVGPTCTAVVGPAKGTLTISDSLADANWVDITLDLVSGDPQTFFFNFSGFPLPAGYAFEADGTTVDVDENVLKADGYSIGFFDLQIPETGNISGNPFETILKLTDGSGFVNLDAAMFNVKSTDSALYAAVNVTTGNSWFGASTSSCIGSGCDGGSEDPVEAPEPASLLLLGAGLVAFARVVRRQRAVAHVTSPAETDAA